MTGEGRSWLNIVMILFLIVALLTCSVPAPVQGAVFTDPIVVEGDSGFSSAGFTGNGTPEEPYVLENVRVNAYQRPHGIKVANTTKHFIIKGCTVTDATTTERDGLNVSASGSGILLYNVENGTVVGFLGQSNVRGITVANGRNVSITASRFADNRGAGVYLKDCPDGSCVVSNNSFFKTLDVPVPVGVLVEDCQGVRVENNSINGGSLGIKVVSTEGRSVANTLLGNTLRNQEVAGVHLGGNFPSSRDIVMGNGVVAPGGTGIYAIFETNGKISGNTVSGCLYGIRVSWKGNEVSGNTLSNNTRGIILGEGADENSVSNNTVQDGAFGIEVGPSQGNMVLGNRVSRIDRESSSVGIYLGIGEVRDALVQGNHVLGCGVGIRAASTPSHEISGMTIRDNVVQGSLRQGAYIINAQRSEVLNNSFASGGGGLFLGECLSIMVEGNRLTDNTGFGLHMRGTSDSVVRSNVFHNCSKEGVYLESGHGSLIHGNAFIFNKGSGMRYSPLRSQAYCGEGGNEWASSTGNLWADWVSPDADADGIVDLPYNISGGFQDPLPVTSLPGVEIPADLIPPAILSWSPQGQDVEANEVVSVTFSEDMDTSTVVVTVNGVEVGGVWNDRTYLLDISLDFETEYQVNVTGRDLSGNELAPFIWNFRTEGREAEVSGRVVDEQGAPLSSVRVSVGDQEVFTDGQGRFNLLLSPGEHLLNISADGFIGRTLPLQVEEGGDMELGDIVLVLAEQDEPSGMGTLALAGVAVMAAIASLLFLALRRRGR